MKVMYLGDTHGSTGHVKEMIAIAKREGVALIVQLGDFGLWPGEAGAVYLRKTNMYLKAAGLELWWLGGNHEWYDKIDEAYQDKEWNEVWRTMSNIVHMPRGYRFELDGLKFLAVGGAYSVDQQWRVPHVSWWPQEEITSTDVKRACDGGKADVLLCHDKPFSTRPRWNRKDIAECLPNQRMLEEIIEVTRPKVVLHGHLHFNYYDRILLPGGHVTAVHGLDCDGTGAMSYHIVDTQVLRSIHAYEKTLDAHITSMSVST